MRSFFLQIRNRLNVDIIKVFFTAIDGTMDEDNENEITLLGSEIPVVDDASFDLEVSLRMHYAIAIFKNEGILLSTSKLW